MITVKGMDRVPLMMWPPVVLVWVVWSLARNLCSRTFEEGLGLVNTLLPRRHLSQQKMASLWDNHPAVQGYAGDLSSMRELFMEAGPEGFSATTNPHSIITGMVGLCLESS